MSVERNTEDAGTSIQLDGETSYMIMMVDASNGRKQFLTKLPQSVVDAVIRGDKFNITNMATEWALSPRNANVTTMSAQLAVSIKMLARHDRGQLYVVEQTLTYRVAKNVKMSWTF